MFRKNYKSILFTHDGTEQVYAFRLSAAGKVLVVFPVPSYSHALFGDSVVKLLLDVGHEVTYISPVTSLKQDVHLKILNASSPLYSVAERERIRLMELVRKPRPPQKILEVGTAFARRVLEHKVTQELLMDPNTTFDLVIAEWYYSGLLAPLASLYSCPLIWYSAVDVSWMNLQLMEGPTNPAYSVDSQARSWTPGYSVIERAARLWKQLYLTAWFYYTMYYVEAPIYEEVYRLAQEKREQLSPDYEILVYNASLMLVNSHPLLGQGLSLPQNVKLVGGHHIEGPLKPLAQNLQDIIEKSKNGVIFFNLGLNVKRKDISEHTKRRLLDIFGQLEQTVIWNFEENLQGHSRNIHILQRVPQMSILNHTNTMMFITQGDLKSCMEAAYFGIPIIGIPLFGEQFLLTELVAARGRGLKVEFNEDMPFKILEAVNEILGNYSYRSQALEASAIFKNRLTSPQKELVYWINLALDPGTYHLASPAVQLSIFQKLYLDILILVVLLLWFLSKIVKVIRVHWSDSIGDDKKDQ